MPNSSRCSALPPEPGGGHQRPAGQGPAGDPPDAVGAGADMDHGSGLQRSAHQLINARAERVEREPALRGALAGAGVPAPAGFDPAAAEGLNKIPRIFKVPMT